MSWFTNPLTVIFQKEEKIISQTIFIFYLLTLNIICLVEKKNNIFFRFCLCIFESDTVKRDCLIQMFREMMKYIKIYYILLVYLTSFTVFVLEILKKLQNKKKP